MVVDVDYALALIALAWAAILAPLVVVAGVDALQRMRRPKKAPFFGVLERHGLTLRQAEQAAGFTGVGEAAGRCAACAVRDACRRALRWGRFGFDAPPCPNASFFARIAGTT